MGRLTATLALRYRAALVAGLVCAALLAPVGPASSEPACAHVSQTLRTFHIEMKPSKKVYRVGQKIVMYVTVTRPGREDPLGEGVPIDAPYRHPAADVDVITGVYGKVGFPGSDIRTTDAEGKATVIVRAVKNYRTEAYVELRAQKRYVANSAACVEPEEIGTATYANPFDVR